MKEKIENYRECVSFFMDKYKLETGIKYSFESKDGKAMKAILVKIDNIKGNGDALLLFEQIINNLSKWDKENGFSLTSINSRFNVIISNIISQKPKLSDGFKKQIISDIFQ